MQGGRSMHGLGISKTNSSSEPHWLYLSYGFSPTWVCQRSDQMLIWMVCKELGRLAWGPGMAVTPGSAGRPLCSFSCIMLNIRSLQIVALAWLLKCLQQSDVQIQKTHVKVSIVNWASILMCFCSWVGVWNERTAGIFPKCKVKSVLF